MRRLVTLIGLVLVIGGVGYLYLFQRDFVTGLFKKGAKEVQELTGAGPAKTPDEALDKYKEFAKKRDYETAAKYVGGLYGEQMTKGAKAAGELGIAVDSVRSLAEKRGITITDKASAALDLLETFPADIQVLEIKKDSDDKARGKVSIRGHAQPVELKRDGDGWKAYFAVANEPALRSAVERLNTKGKDYVRALDKIREQIMNKEIQTKDELEAKLLAGLSEAFQ